MPDNTVEIHGLEELHAKFRKFPVKVARNVGQAGVEAGKDVVLKTKGLQNYAAATSANKPPTPYYIRSVGTQTSAAHNLMNSENMGRKWVVKAQGWQTRVGNIASYSKWVHGHPDDPGGGQAKHMGPQGKPPKGWRILRDVAKEKIGAIQAVYNKWVAKTLREIGLK